MIVIKFSYFLYFSILFNYVNIYGYVHIYICVCEGTYVYVHTYITLFILERFYGFSIFIIVDTTSCPLDFSILDRVRGNQSQEVASRGKFIINTLELVLVKYFHFSDMFFFLLLALRSLLLFTCAISALTSSHSVMLGFLGLLTSSI